MELEGFRLSAQQQLLWRSADAAADPVGCVLSLAGPVADADILDALAVLVDANEILRTSFRRLPEMALPLQVVRDSAPVRWRSQDMSRLSDGSRDRACADLVALVRDEQVDLGRDPLLTALFVRLGDDQAVLYLQLPAAVADAQTMVNLVDLLAETMDARRDGRPAPAPGLQYVEFSEWRHELATAGGEDATAGADYWARSGLPGESPGGPAPDPDPPGGRTVRRASLCLGPRVGERLDRAGRHLGAGSDAILLAAWACLASRVTGRPDVVIETLFDGRRLEELRGSLGPFADRLPVRIAAGPERTGAEVIGEIAGALAAHREWLEFAPSARPAPAAGEFGFGYLEHGAGRRCGPVVLSITSLTDRVSRPGPTLLCRRTGQELVLGVTVGPATGADPSQPAPDDILGYFASALDSLLGDTGRRLDALALISAERRRELLAGFGAGARRPPGPGTFPGLFAEQAGRAPDAVALACGHALVTYARLRRQASGVASLLAGRGIGRGDVVALSLDRGPLAVIVMVGILQAGAAFLVIDPADPPARKVFVCTDARAALLITSARDAGRPPVSGCPVLALPDDAGAGRTEAVFRAGPLSGTDAAYVCYTSGTTGEPNGVLVQHGSLVNYLRWVHREIAGDIQLPLVSRLTFDASLKQALGPLLHGGQVWLLPEPTLADPRSLFQALSSRSGAGYRIGFNGVPALWAAVLRAAEEAPRGDADAFRLGMRAVLLGGEALPGGLVARTEAFLPGAEMWNLYGPTEATANASAGRVGQAHGVSIGRPVDNVQILLLDRYLEPVPAGVPGRLFVAGAGVARCYIGRPGLTASRFRPHPFSGVPGDRMYDTGDVARFLPDGRVDFLGRDDLQVKINGFRIEPEGVEATMAALPGVREAALAVQTAASGATELVGCLVPDSPAPLPMPELRSLLARTLPRYAVPTRFLQLSELPRTPAAKLDRAALRELARGEERGSAGVAGHRSLIEAEVAGIWARLLGADSIGPDDNFFSLGGHSLLTVELISRVQEATGVLLVAQTVFEAPTLREFSARIEDELAGGSGAARPALERVSRDRPLPVSFSQQRLLLLESLEPGVRRHNLLAARRIVGTISEDGVRRALDAIAARHEILRTGFVAGPRPAQVITGEVAVPLTVTDLRASAGRDPELAEVQRLADRLLGQGFSLESPPLMRAELVRLGQDDAVLLLALHRLVCDGWAKALLFEEFASLYGAAITGTAGSLPELAVQYADYAAWERRCVTDQVLAEQLAYWRQRLAGTGPPRLPADHPRTKAPSHRGHAVHRRLSAGLTQVLRRLAMDGGSTLFMTTLAAFAMLLSRYTGQSDIVVVTPVTARKRAELAALIGPFLNLVALRVDLTRDPSFAELLRRVRESAFAANARQDLPFERLADELLAGRGGSRASAFPVMFNFARAPEPEIDVCPGTVLRIADVEPGSSAYDLELLVEEEPQNLLIRLIADLDLYESTTAERMLANFEALLRSVGEEPDRPMSEHFLAVPPDRAAAGRAQPQRTAGRRGFIDTIFTARARTSAHLPAVRSADASVSYGDLDGRSNQLAHYLTGRGVVPGQVVALLMDATADLVATMIAVIKIGAGFLALDGQAPAERLRREIADGHPAVLVTTADQAARIGSVAPEAVCLDAVAAAIAACPAGSPGTGGRDPRHPACVIPGARGGAVVSHQSLAWATAARSAYYAEPVQSMLVPGPAGSGRFVAAALWTLCSGGCLLLPGAPDGEPQRIARLVDDGEVTHLMASTSLYLALHDRRHRASLASLRTVILSGDPLYGPQVGAHFRRLPQTGLFHEYSGPECGGWGMVYECSPADEALDLVPVSASRADGRWRVLNRSWLEVPDGVPGELFAGGPHTALGYQGHPALTAGRFVPDPWAGRPGALMHGTGDLARVGLDGSVVVFGALDEQVRLPGLAGHRIPLDQAEAGLLRQEGVREAAVVARADAAGGRGLIAYLVPAGPGPVDEERLRRRLQSALPGHLVPGQYVQLDELPRRRDGALDRTALDRTALAVAPPATDQADPQAAAGQPGLVTKLAEIWAEEFDIARVTADDDFFALGGNSLLALHLLARIEDEFDVTLPLQALFEAPTVTQLAEAVAASLAEEG